MEKLEWTKVYYNGLETNIEVTRCGRVRRVKVDWLKYSTSAKLGEVDFSKLKSNKGYMQITIQTKGLKKKTAQIQQLIAAVFLDYNFNGNKLVIDHIDSNKLNNNVTNLRVVTNRENSSKEKTLKSGLPVGVCWDKLKNKYRSQITINKKKTYLGLFDTIEEASKEYKNKLKTL